MKQAPVVFLSLDISPLVAYQTVVCQLFLSFNKYNALCQD